MMAPPPTGVTYWVMINCPATESVGVPCEYAKIGGRLLPIGRLDQTAHGRFGLQ